MRSTGPYEPIGNQGHKPTGEPFYAAPCESSSYLPYDKRNAFNNWPGRSFLAGNPNHPVSFFTCIREGEFIHSLMLVSGYCKLSTRDHFYKFDTGDPCSIGDFSRKYSEFTCFSLAEFVEAIARKAESKPTKYGELLEYVLENYV